MAGLKGGQQLYKGVRLTGVVLVVLLLLRTDTFAQTIPPYDYLNSNIGLTGFGDGQGIRLKQGQPRGIRAGKFVIWPSLLLEGRWDSNVFREDSLEGLDSAPIMRIVPGIAVANPDGAKLRLRFGLESDVRLYFSESGSVSEQGSVGVKSDLHLEIMPRGPFTVTIYDIYRRMLETRNLTSSQNYNQNINRAGLRMNIHPGGGALSVILGYSFNVNIFDEFEAGNHQFHEVELLSTWRFFPKTALLFEVRSQFREWASSDTEGLYVENKPFRAYVGLNGYFTKKLAALIKLGYGNSFYDSGPNFGTIDCEGSDEPHLCRLRGLMNVLLVHTELSFRFTPNILAAVGFSRDFQDSYYANYFSDNKTYLRGQFRFANRVGLDLAAAFHLIDFAPFDPGAEGIPNILVSHRQRRDQVVSAHAKIDVDVTRWIGFSLGYEMRAVFTNFRVEEAVADLPVPLVDFGRYVKHQVYGSVNIRY